MKTLVARIKNLLLLVKLLPFDITNALHEYQREMASHPKERFQDPKRLLQFGYKVFSQNDEDGILEEIFRRIGTTSRTFVEFGVGPHENNSLRLLLMDWSGLWLDGSTANVTQARHDLGQYIESDKLRVRECMIDKDNINGLIEEGGCKGEIDLLSIDLDGNDYWIWKAIDVVQPRVVCIEYNATLRPPISVTMHYNATHAWDGTNFFGASLKALEKLGEAKGYRLVACNLTGINAFFVKEDLVKDLFAYPFTAENHYEPPRYFGYRAGHVGKFGSYTQV